MTIKRKQNLFFTFRNNYVKLINSIIKLCLELFIFDRNLRRRMKGKFCQCYLKKYVKQVEKEFIQTSKSNVEKTYRIWQYWNSGEENAPDLVRACLASVDKYRGNTERVILNDNNIKDYVTIPDFIYELREKGIISNTHFSDILRTYLLDEYGGCWIDATVLLTAPLPEFIRKSELFVLQNDRNKDADNLGMTSYFISSKGHSIIISKAKRLLELYWKDNNFLINYFLFLHAFSELMQSSEENIKEVNEMHKFSYLDVQRMEKQLLEPYTEQKWNELISISPIHKLSYKWKVINPKKEYSLCKSNYQHIIDEYLPVSTLRGLNTNEKVSRFQDLKSKWKGLFSIQQIDEHNVIKVFGIKFCKKFKYNYILEELQESGVISTKRATQIIVSLTTFPARINSVHKTITTLLQQTLKPDRVILWLAQSQFPNKELPQDLLNLQKYGLEIKWCERDIKSYKKLIPTLEECPNDIIITTDDDYYYDKRLVESLYNEYLKHPNCIIARQAFVLKLGRDKLLKMNARSYTYDSTYLPSFKNEPVGCGGVLYPPNSLHENVLNIEQFLKEIPTHDDLWFWVHALRNGTKIKVLKNAHELKHIMVEGSQEDSLWQKNMINSTSTVGMTGKCALNKVCEMFPEAKEKIINVLK